MAIVRYKCHTTHKVKVTDHDALMRPNTLTTHFYKELTQTVGKIITSSNTQYKCITAHKYWQNEDPYTVSPQSYRAGTLYNVGQTFNSGGVKYKVNTAYWWWDNAVTEGGGKIKAGTKVTANQIITSGGIQYKALKEFWYFDNVVTEGGSNLKKGTKVNVGQTFQADNGTYTCIKAFWHWSAWTDFRTQKRNNQYFTYKVNDPLEELKSQFHIVSEVNQNADFVQYISGNASSIIENHRGYAQLVALSNNKIVEIMGSSIEVEDKLGALVFKIGFGAICLANRNISNVTQSFCIVNNSSQALFYNGSSTKQDAKDTIAIGIQYGLFSASSRFFLCVRDEGVTY